MMTIFLLMKKQMSNVNLYTHTMITDYLLGNNDPWDRIIAAKKWMTWEMSVSKMSLKNEHDEHSKNDDSGLTTTTIYQFMCHQLKRRHGQNAELLKTMEK